MHDLAFAISMTSLATLIESLREDADEGVAGSRERLSVLEIIFSVRCKLSAVSSLDDVLTNMNVALYEGPPAEVKQDVLSVDPRDADWEVIPMSFVNDRVESAPQEVDHHGNP